MPDAVRAFVGNFKGPKGEQGPQGMQGPAGPQGIQGPAGPSNADGIDTVDTSGVFVSAGESTDLQRLIDAIADKVMTKLLAKTDIVQVESTATNTVPSSAYLKSVKDDINSNLELLYSADSLSIATQDIILPQDFSTYKIIIIYLAINYNGSILHFSDFLIRLPTDSKITSNFTLSSYFNNTGFLSIRCSLFTNLLQIKEISVGTSWSGQKMALYVYGK